MRFCWLENASVDDDFCEYCRKVNNSEYINNEGICILAEEREEAVSDFYPYSWYGDQNTRNKNYRP